MNRSRRSGTRCATPRVRSGFASGDLKRACGVADPLSREGTLARESSTGVTASGGEASLAPPPAIIVTANAAGDGREGGARQGCQRLVAIEGYS